ncbi:MAG: ABC transporter permease [Actinobacteria bacterium]|nr:MAG: ABC transporter permease [Actinomycetota bacterium]
MTETKVKPPRASAPETSPTRSTELDRARYVTVIRPATQMPRIDLRELWRYRELLGIFVWRDLKVRYKQTVIGGAWAIFQPALTALVYTLVFGRFAKFPSGRLPYPVFAFAGVLAWQYFSASLNIASASIVGNVPLVTKVYFPRLLLPLAGVVVPLIDLCLAGFVLVAMMAWYSTWPGAAVLVAPFFILLALVAALGAALALSALNTRYRDVPYAIPAFMQVLPFLSAVPFALDGVPLRWQWVLSINPMTAVVSGWRWAVLGGPQPILGQLGLSVGVAILVFIGGLAYFRRSEPRFADTI